MSSLRGRLILWQIVGITLFLATNGLVIQRIARSHLESELDETLLLTARSLAPALRREAAEHEFDAPRPGPPRPALTTERTDVLFELRTPEGDTLARSDALQGRSLPRLAEGLAPSELVRDLPGELEYADVELPPDGRAGRVLAFTLEPPHPRPDRGERPGPPPRDDEGFQGFPRRRPMDPALREERRQRRGELAGPPGTPGGPGRPDSSGPFEVVVAADRTQLLQRLRDLRLLLVLAWVSCSAGSAAILWWVVHRSLRPLGRLSREIEGLEGGRLAQRFDIPDAPAELAPVIAELNLLLDRIQGAFDREQAFTADAAHELRTPLAGLRSTLELALSRERSSAEHRRAATEALAITEEMQSLVADLLFLSRGATGLEERLEDVALADLVARSIERFAPAAAARGLAFDVHVDPTLEVRTDRALLDRVLSNLVENAVSYADENARIELRARRDQRHVTLAVENPAADAPADLPDKAFLAFWRADTARSKTGTHAGLGLSLCKRIVEQLGGEIVARFEDGRVTVRVVLRA